MADAVQMLREDHNKVKGLFQEFERATDSSTKKGIVDTALMELQIHSSLEEEIFYPAVDRANIVSNIVDLAEEEHHVAKLLIEELMYMSPGDPHYDAKFKVLAEGVKKHIQEEESEILPQAQQLGSDQLSRLGEQMMERKQSLQEQMRTRSRA